MVTETLVIRTVMLGGKETTVTLVGEATALKAVGAAAVRTSLALSATTKRTWLMNQAMFTARRLLYGVSLAAIAAGGYILKLGWDYNSAMQQARVALAPVFSDNQQLEDQLNKLFHIAAFTPFQFKDITIAFRQMFLGMRTIGISADTVTETIQSLADALSAVGRTSPGALNRVAVALQHMAFQGRLTGQVVLQLARDGLPVYAVLEKKMGLTADQMRNIGQLGIPAEAFLKALNAYIRETPGFANAALRQSTKTFHGMWTTVLDFTSRIMGNLEKGLFTRVQKWTWGMFQSMEKIDQTTRNAKSMTDIMRALNQALTPGSDAILTWWLRFRNIIHNLWVIFSKELLPAFLTAAKVLGYVIAPAVWILNAALAILANNNWVVRKILILVITILLIYRARLIYARIAVDALRIAQIAYNLVQIAWYGLIKKAILMYKLERSEMILTTKVINGIRRAYELWNFAVLGTLRGNMRTATSLTKLETGILKYRNKIRLMLITMRSWRIWTILNAAAAYIYAAAAWVATAATAAWNAVLEINPIVAVVTALVIMTYTFLMLYKHVKAFRNFINKYWPELIALFLLGPVGAALVYLALHFDMVKRAAMAVWNALKTAFMWLYNFLKTNWPLVVGAMFSPLGLAVAFAITRMDTLKSWLRDTWNLIRRVWNWLKKNVFTLKFALQGWSLVKGALKAVAHGAGWLWNKVKPYQSGGTATQNQWGLVGERGPELMYMPKGSTVVPLDRRDTPAPWQNWGGGGGGQRPIEIIVPVILEGKQIARVVAKYNSDRVARA